MSAEESAESTGKDNNKLTAEETAKNDTVEQATAETTSPTTASAEAGASSKDVTEHLASGDDAASTSGHNERSNPVSTGDDEADDPLVIDEADAKSEGGDSDEKEFEPTIEMIMNDFDDEQTMEEEEALEAEEDEGDELAALEQEQDMPLEELLKLYNYAGAGGGHPSAGSNVAGGDGDDAVDAASDDDVDDDEDYDDDDDDDDDEEAVRKREARQNKNNGVKSSKPKTSKSSDLTKKRDRDSDGDDGSGGSQKSGEKRRGSDSPTPTSGSEQPPKKSRSELARFYEATVEGRALRSTSGGGLAGDEVDDEGSEAEDSDSEGRDFSWKKTIMIGPTYQAAVPADLSCYDDTLPYENEDKKLWDPSILPEEIVEDFLANSGKSGQPFVDQTLPNGAHIRDDEQDLFLLHQCGYNSEEALRRRRLNQIPPADTMSTWSEEECRAFELGLRLYGKDFHMIQTQRVRTRSVGELVQFYYFWKKTERHDVFANSTRLEKKKYTLHPGTTDYMDRFIDEQDQSRDRSSSPTHHSLIFGSEAKKGLSLHPAANKSPNVSNGNDSIENNQSGHVSSASLSARVTSSPAPEVTVNGAGNLPAATADSISGHALTSISGSGDPGKN